MTEPPSRGLASGTTLMAAGTAVSRVLGMVRNVALIWVIGTFSQAANAFSVANTVPTYLYNLLVSGVLSAVLVPQVVRAYKRAAGQEYVDRLLTLGFAALAALTLLLTLATPLLVQLFGHGHGGPRLELAIAFGYWTLPQVFFYGMYALLGQVLNARGSFGPFTWAPAANNVVAIIGLGVFAWLFGAAGEHAAPAADWTAGQIAVLAGGATLGIVAQGLVLIPAMRRAGINFRPRWDFRGVGLRTSGDVAVWTFVALMIGLVSQVAITQAASAAADSSGHGTAVAGYAVYQNAFLVFMLPHSLVTLSLITALFPRVSAQAADHDHDAVAASMSLGLRAVGVFTVLVTAAGVVLAGPLARAVLPSASTTSIALTSPVLVALLLGLPVFGVWSVCQRVYYAYEDARGLVPVAVAMAVVVLLGTTAVRLTLPATSWTAGAGAAISASYGLASAMTLAGLKVRMGRIGGRAAFRTYLRATLAVLPAAGVGWVTLAGLRAVGVVDRGGWGGWALAIGLCVLVGGLITVVYVLCLRFLHVTELDVLASSLRRVVARRRTRRGV